MVCDRGNVRVDVEELDGGVQVSVLVGRRVAGRSGRNVVVFGQASAAHAQQAGIGRRERQVGSQYVKSHHVPPLVVPEI